ncbi:MAG: hypothetical protein J3K34DRAFT_442446 [Monoraphidium minutum]|nr:MAG: hypothetical protein J3K34DRAFT_442446 [Monoraphidium minutum]
MWWVSHLPAHGAMGAPCGACSAGGCQLNSRSAERRLRGLVPPGLAACHAAATYTALDGKYSLHAAWTHRLGAGVEPGVVGTGCISRGSPPSRAPRCAPPTLPIPHPGCPQGHAHRPLARGAGPLAEGGDSPPRHASPTNHMPPHRRRPPNSRRSSS